MYIAISIFLTSTGENSSNTVLRHNGFFCAKTKMRKKDEKERNYLISFSYE